MCCENRHKFFVFIATLLQYGPVFILGGALKAHGVLPITSVLGCGQPNYIKYTVSSEHEMSDSSREELFSRTLLASHSQREYC